LRALDAYQQLFRDPYKAWLVENREWSEDAIKPAIHA
jgi:hypothetical protein